MSVSVLSGPRGRTALVVALLAAVAACGSSGPSSSPPATSAASRVLMPATAAGRQATWLDGAVVHDPIPDAQIRAHFDSTFLSQVGPAKLNATLKGVTSVAPDAITSNEPDSLVYLATVNGSQKLSVSITTDSRGLISGLRLAPASDALPATPTSWAGVQEDFTSAALNVEYLVASVHGNTCTPVKASGAATVAPLGSEFKLYVLDALARAVAAGKVRWNQPLTVTSQVKSLPSGELQNDPDGTKVSVQKAATGMISISDNTAEDMLAGLVGRNAIQAATQATGMADPARDDPFLTTRELFVLKTHDWPSLANKYLAASQAGRQALLASQVDHDPLGASAWATPRDPGTLEWFASAQDICHAYTSLASLAQRPGLAPLSQIMSVNDGGLDLPSSQWKPVWFKGGSEPGVVTLSYLATTATGRTYFVGVMAENPATTIPSSATAKLLSGIKGALTLAAK